MNTGGDISYHTIIYSFHRAGLSLKRSTCFEYLIYQSLTCQSSAQGTSLQKQIMPLSKDIFRIVSLLEFLEARQIFAKEILRTSFVSYGIVSVNYQSIENITYVIKVSSVMQVFDVPVKLAYIPTPCLRFVICSSRI